MGMRLVGLAACGLLLAAGCGPRGTPGTGGEEDLGPVRFAHSAIRRTVAPWDGAATQLVLSEKPPREGRPAGPHVSIHAYQDAGDLSGQRLRLSGTGSREGLAAWIDAEGKSTPLTAEIHFGEVRDGAPVTGTYAVTFPDGRQERGRFRAEWWKARGPGG